MAASLDQARTVKNTVIARVGAHPAVNGVGLARANDGWAVKVNLCRPAPELELPSSIEGVPIWVDIVGRIVAR